MVPKKVGSVSKGKRPEAKRVQPPVIPVVSPEQEAGDPEDTAILLRLEAIKKRGVLGLQMPSETGDKWTKYATNKDFRCRFWQVWLHWRMMVMRHQ